MGGGGGGVGAGGNFCGLLFAFPHTKICSVVISIQWNHCISYVSYQVIIYHLSAMDLPFLNLIDVA